MKLQHRKKLGYAILAVLMVTCFLGFSSGSLAREKEEMADRLKWFFNVSVVDDLRADFHGNFV